MTLYEKDKSFSIGWVFGGAVIMFVMNLFASLLISLTGLIYSLPIAVGTPCLCFLLGGFIVGRASAGRTILEAGLGGGIAAAATIALIAVRVHGVTPMGIALGSILPFVCALLGGLVGEKLQGDSVEVQD